MTIITCDPKRNKDRMHNWRKKVYQPFIKKYMLMVMLSYPFNVILSMWSTHKCHQTRGLCCSMLWI